MLAATATPDPPIALIIPFVALLLCIACGPLTFAKLWEPHYPKFAVAFGLIPVGYYLLVFSAGERLLHVLWEYLSFVIFIGSLFVAAGGVVVRTKGGATPLRNTVFLAVGAVLANVIGTTGASMLLIRPWMRMNKYRFTSLHAAFFIFAVSNIGGCLTPIGDPPLLLGYLKGVPFFWTLRCLPAWGVALSLVLLVFYFVDRRNFLRAPAEVRDAGTANDEFRIDGARNFLLIAVMLGAIIWAPPGWREAALLLAAFVSYKTTPRDVHAANNFSFHPVHEIAWLFAGIFATMVPALDYLSHHAADLGVEKPAGFYWLTGILSSVLDNAPTYLAALATALGRNGLSIDNPAHVAAFAAEYPQHLLAISLAAVFFGAGTYIGNGPNFLVKAICQHAGVRTPGFFEYILRFALPVLVPIFALVAWLFFSR